MKNTFNLLTNCPTPEESKKLPVNKLIFTSQQNDLVEINMDNFQKVFVLSDKNALSIKKFSQFMEFQKCTR